MPTITVYASACVWGSSSFNNNSDLKVGKTGSSSTDGTKYKGRLTFPAIPSNWVIRSITLKLQRIDSYSTHTLQFGGSLSSGFSAALAFYFNKSISSGKNAKYIDLTAYAGTIQGFGNTWYLHIRHGSGSNSYSEFNGDEDAAGVRPQLTIVYEQATVYVNVDGVWKTCLVYYRDNETWVQCVPYYNDSGTWKQV